MEYGVREAYAPMFLKFGGICSYPAGIIRLRLIKNFTKMSKWNFLFTYFCEVPRERYNFTFTSFWGVNVKLYKMDRLIEL